MRQSKFTETQIVAILNEADASRPVNEIWRTGWEVVRRELANLTDSYLQTAVQIRGTRFTVHEALSRLVAHAAYHVGQIVLLARILSGERWRWISIPKGKSEDYNRNPTMEKRPD